MPPSSCLCLVLLVDSVHITYAATGTAWRRRGNQLICDAGFYIGGEKLAMLHWGTSAVHAYDEQYKELAASIRVFEMTTELRNSKHFVLRPPVAPPKSKQLE
ncbi:hypothetical protein B0H11DRAFT_2212335 [Mycena galericulata]|nr:hypothetical protein B0H11DRAFT_2212335 [Mycena galericulata]